MSTQPSEDSQPAWAGHTVATFAGQLDTHIRTGEDYQPLALIDIFTMQPAARTKGAGPAMIPSSYRDYDARKHEVQRDRGQFVALCGDVDSGDHPLETIQTAVQSLIGDAAWLIYSSPHSRPGDTRWRIVLPLASPASFTDWYDAQTAFFDFMEAAGIKMDRALGRAAQPVYLPNVPDVHKASGTPLRGEDGEPLYFERAHSPLDARATLIAADRIAGAISTIRRQRAADDQERDRIRREAEQRRANRPQSESNSLIADFNASNSIATMLEICGYEQSPRSPEDWRSKYQTGETYATRIIGDKWVSLSASDASARVGEQCKSGCYGDAYDLFVHYKHGGQHKAAFRALHDERRAAQPNVVYPPQFEPPEWMNEAPAYDKAPEWADAGMAEPEEPMAAQHDETDTFELLDMDELEALPAPEWLIKDLVVDDGLTTVFGDPGAGKSFVVLDMCLRLALGMDWHGAETKQTGILYIAGEGARGLGKRVKGWRKEHGKQGAKAPFMLLPVPVALLDPAQRAKLLRTIDEAMRRSGFPIGLVVIDTLSRSLAGAGENGADEMGALVASTDIVRQHTGGAVLGVHHSGKDKEKGMRGSTVLLGACDGVIRVSKDGELVTLKTEKQKDAEESAPIYMRMKKVSWPVEGDEWLSTLVPFITVDRPVQKEEMTDGQVIKAFAFLTGAWSEGRPLSTAPQTRNQGRYAPSVLSKSLQCSETLVSEYLTAWLENGCITIEEVDSHSKKTGLRVINTVVPGMTK